MANYLVQFRDDFPSVGPSEVHYAEVLPGWVLVKWRDTADSVTYYPSHAVISVRTPTPVDISEE